MIERKRDREKEIEKAVKKRGANESYVKLMSLRRATRDFSTSKRSNLKRTDKRRRDREKKRKRDIPRERERERERKRDIL
jgi:hypothetical protein